jgi:FkbM family methyltransferase
MQCGHYYKELFTMKRFVKEIVRKSLFHFGYRISKIDPFANKPGSVERGIGSMGGFLEDVRARGLQPEHILDVGANCAEWSWLASKIFTKAKFTLIEPQHEMKPDLDAFCHGIMGSRWIEAGAGPRQGVMILTVWPDLKGSSLLLTENEAEESKRERRNVKVITIDSVFC